MDTILAQALGQESPPSTTEEKRRLLSRLLGRLAHEIRNPLSSLDIHVQLLEEDLAQTAPQAQAKLAGRLDIICGELHRLDTIVQQSASSWSRTNAACAPACRRPCHARAAEAPRSS
jgi:signal transduction histidine kinase